MSNTKELKSELKNIFKAMNDCLNVSLEIEPLFLMLWNEVNWSDDEEKAHVSHWIEDFVKSKKLPQERREKFNAIFYESCNLHTMFDSIDLDWPMVYCTYLFAKNNEKDKAIEFIRKVFDQAEEINLPVLLDLIPKMREILKANGMLNNPALNFVQDYLLKQMRKSPTHVLQREEEQVQRRPTIDYQKLFSGIQNEISRGFKVKALFILCDAQIDWYRESDVAILRSKMKEFTDNDLKTQRQSDVVPIRDWTMFYQDLLATAIFYYDVFRIFGPCWKYIHFPYMYFRHYGMDSAKELMKSFKKNQRIRDEMAEMPIDADRYIDIAERHRVVDHLPKDAFLKEYKTIFR